MILAQNVSAPTLSVGDPEPNVVFRRPGGEGLRISGYRGRIVVLEFTSYSCPACRSLAPYVESLAKDRPNVVFITVCADSSKTAARLFQERSKDAKTVFLEDPLKEDRTKMAVWQFGNPGFPSLFVIGRDGRMASRLIMGENSDLSHLRARIEWAKTR